MKNEIEISKGSGNVFEDLGFEQSEEMLAKVSISLMIADILRRRSLSQAEAAKLLGETQPKISNIMNGVVKNISLEKLIAILMKLDRDVKIIARKHRAKRPSRIIFSQEAA